MRDAATRAVLTGGWEHPVEACGGENLTIGLQSCTAGHTVLTTATAKLTLANRATIFFSFICLGYVI